MGANPMQKMKRNSTLTGLIIGLSIGLILCVILYLFLSSTGVGKKEEQVYVYVLNTNVKSGTVFTAAETTPKAMNTADVPSDIVSIPADTNVVAKIDLPAGTILTSGMLTAATTTITNDLREQEYNMITLPTNLETDEFIDIRLQLPNGGDYIVISKKQVLKCDSTTIWLNMCEEEISIMSSAILEYYTMPGSKLYAAKYIEPGLQTASVGTYVPSGAVRELIKSNPNITSLINSDRYSEALTNIRNGSIEAELNKYSDEKLKNIEEKLQEEIKALKESRELYFGTLNAAY